MNLANKITLFRIFLVPLFMLFATPLPQWITEKSELLKIISKYNMWIATGIFIVAAITDKLDGYIARKYNQVTRFGSLVDPLADKLMITAALLFLVQQKEISSWAAVIIICRELAVTGLRISAAYNKRVLSADKYGKIKLVVQVIAIPLCLVDNYPLKFITSIPLDNIMMVLAVLITTFSGINYFVKNWDVFYDEGHCAI